MPFQYDTPGTGYIRQGEIIKGVFELPLKIPAEAPLDQDKPADFGRVDHPIAIVVTPDCDLDWDYKARRAEAPSHKLLSHILFCDLFISTNIHARKSVNSESFRRIRSNQDERYHTLIASPIKEGDTLPEIVSDFKTIFAVRTDFVYWLVETDQVDRLSLLPSPYLEDLMHRLYSFLGRVAVPAPESTKPPESAI